MAIRPRFGPAGKPPWFKCTMAEVPVLLAKEGLDAFEFQAVRMGMPDQKVSVEKADALRKNAEKSDVWVTLHAPYFVNLAAESEETYNKSIQRLISSMRVAKWMGARQVVVHPGYYGKLQKEKALKKCIKALQKVIDATQSEGIKKVWLGPETSGKVTQLGELEEIMRMCKATDQIRPTVDFAHIHARGSGVIRSKDDYVKIIDVIESRLGSDVVKHLHCHYTRVEYGGKGELKHHTMEETSYGPDFEPLAELIAELGLSPVIISESPILDKDSMKMRDIIRAKMETKE